MIEIIREERQCGTNENGGLPKDIKQMGKPDIGDRIYVENQVYQRMHPYENPEEMTAYVLLGRFENYAGKQCVFVEAAILLEEMAFEGEVPLWNDQTWAYIYKQLKHEYDNMVIVGWALDIKGQLPNMTARMEALHQSHFGGAHQVLFLMDSLEREEAFYCNRSGRLYRREGFYVYYRKTRERELTSQKAFAADESKTAWNMPTRQEEPQIVWEEAQTQEQEMTAGDMQEMTAGGVREEDAFEREQFYADDMQENPVKNRGSYREQLYGKKIKGWENAASGAGERMRNVPGTGGMGNAYTAVLAVIVCALGATAFFNYQKLDAMEAAIAGMNVGQVAQTEMTEAAEATEVTVVTVAGNVSKQEAVNADTQNADTQNADAQSADMQSTETAVNSQDAADAKEQSADTEAASNSGDTADAEKAAAQSADSQGTADTEATEALTEAQIYLQQGYYVVQQGDSLVGICRTIYQTTAMMDKLCEVNDIEDENAIYAGQYLTLPN